MNTPDIPVVTGIITHRRRQRPRGNGLRGQGKREVEAGGVECIVPATEVDPDNPPVLFGTSSTPHAFLPVYILVWVWRANPSGTFADFNPNVRPCP